MGFPYEGDKLNNNKRKILKTLLGISGISALPASWKKPIVDSVALPIHAQTSAIVPPVSSPSINPIDDITANYNGGNPTVVSVTVVRGSNIQRGAAFTYSSAPSTVGDNSPSISDILSIDSALGVMMLRADYYKVGTAVLLITVKVVNPDGGADTESFKLHIVDNT